MLSEIPIRLAKYNEMPNIEWGQRRKTSVTRFGESPTDKNPLFCIQDF